MFIKNTMKIRDRKTDKIYECFTQSVSLDLGKTYVLRYNIGINGYNEWSNVCCEYSNEDFNNNYEVITQ